MDLEIVLKSNGKEVKTFKSLENENINEFTARVTEELEIELLK